jgi:fucose 4-O-acetylase-like acetyltransferase
MADHGVAGSGLGSAEIDAIKGFFIVLIVAGHNTLVGAVLPRSSEVLYNFHVFAFLLLPFLLTSHPLGRGFAADRAVRYLVPHACFYLLAAALFAASRLPEAPLAESAGRALAGLVLGTPGAIERGCGLRAYWFLPAIFSLALLRAAMTGSRATAAALAGAGLAFHLAAGALGADVEDWLVFGLSIALFMLPLGFAATGLWRLREGVGRGALTALALAVWAGTQLVAFEQGSFVRLAGLKVPSAAEPLRLLLHDALALSAFVSICGLSSRLARVPGLAWLGRQSLFIYLIHSLVFQGILAALGVRPGRGAPGGSVALAAGSLAATLALSALAAHVITTRPALRDLIAPRTAREWWPLRLLTRAPT